MDLAEHAGWPRPPAVTTAAAALQLARQMLIERGWVQKMPRVRTEPSAGYEGEQPLDGLILANDCATSVQQVLDLFARAAAAALPIPAQASR